jgi:Tol biopolymer transport system component
MGGTADLGNLFVYELSSGEHEQLTDFELSSASWYELHMDFSPDGREVIFDLPRTASDSNTKWDVWSVPVTGGEPTLMVRNAAFPLYLADRKEIAFVPPLDDFNGDSIAIASVDGSRRTLTEMNKLEYRLPQISPDRRRIAYSDDGSVYVVDVSTGETSKVGRWENWPILWLDNDMLMVSPS